MLPSLCPRRSFCALVKHLNRSFAALHEAGHSCGELSERLFCLPHSENITNDQIRKGPGDQNDLQENRNLSRIIFRGK